MTGIAQINTAVCDIELTGTAVDDMLFVTLSW